jgi:hypothetical protein
VTELEGLALASLAVTNNANEARVTELEGLALASFATTNNANHARFEEVERMSLELFARSTRITADLQDELVKAVTAGAMKELQMGAEIQDFEERFRLLNDMYVKEFVHHNEVEQGLQNELIGAVVGGAVDKMRESVVVGEKLDEEAERGMMTANELELKNDMVSQCKDRIVMQDLDLQGYMARRRELRDRMHNVSSVVRDWRGKIRKAGSSLIKAQGQKSRYTKVQPVMGETLFGEKMGGGMNRIQYVGV